MLLGFATVALGGERDDVIRRIETLLTDGRPADALIALRDAGETIDSFDRHMLTGRACIALNRLPPAIAAFEQALRDRPHSTDALFRLGRAFASKGDAARAVTAFERAADAGLQSSELHADWARSLLTLGMPLGPLSDAVCARTTLPGDRLHDGRVVVRLIEGQPGRCVTAGRKGAIYHALLATQLSTQNGANQLLVADVWSAAGQRDLALRHYAEAAKQLPPVQRGECYERWAECLLAMRDYEGYFARLRDWMSLPDGISPRRLADAYTRVATAMRDGGDVPRQISYLTFAVELEPRSCDRRLALSDALLGVGRIAEAADQWREILRDCPKHARSAELRRWLAELEMKPSPP